MQIQMVKAEMMWELLENTNYKVARHLPELYSSSVWWLVECE